MNVSIARRAISREVSAGIIRMIELKYLSEEARTTALFISLADTWFHIINNRKRAHALCNNHPETNENSYNQLLLFANFFAQCIVLDPKRHNCWTPVQKGILLSTRSFIELARILFSSGMIFLLAARFTSDAIKSLFSIMRFISGPNANALKMCRVIKLMIASDLLNSSIPSFNDNSAVNYIVMENNYSLSIDPFAEVALLSYMLDRKESVEQQTEVEVLYYIAGAIARFVYNLSKPLYLRKSKAIVLCPTCEALLNSNNLTLNNIPNLLNNDLENVNYSRFTKKF